MVNRTHDSLALGRHYALFDENWPIEMSLMASRKWSNIHVNNMHYEIQSSFFSENLDDIDHLTVSVLLSTYDAKTFEEWLADLCSKLVADNLDADWLNNQKLAQDLNQQLRMRIKVVWTLPSDEPGPADHTSLHVGIVIRSQSE